jgi:chromatin assembly factor 1 subunit A
MRGIGLMNPPRAPLGARPNNVINSAKTQPADQTKTGKAVAIPGAAPKAPESQKRMVPQELMQEFKAEISGSDLTKIAMIEALKKK